MVSLPMHFMLTLDGVTFSCNMHANTSHIDRSLSLYHNTCTSSQHLFHNSFMDCFSWYKFKQQMPFANPSGKISVPPSLGRIIGGIAMQMVVWLYVVIYHASSLVLRYARESWSIIPTTNLDQRCFFMQTLSSHIRMLSPQPEKQPSFLQTTTTTIDDNKVC